MPKKAVKPFISKKTGESFTVVHRSQQDPKYYDEDSSKYVLMSTKAAQALPLGMGGSVAGSVCAGAEGDDRSSLHSGMTGDGSVRTSRTRASRVSRLSVASNRSSVLLRRVGGGSGKSVHGSIAELSEVDAMGLPLDGYDYGRHLSETGGGLFISASGSVMRGGSGASVASGRSGASARTGGRGATRGAGGALDTLSEVDEADGASGGADDAAEAVLEALVRGVEDTRLAGARVGLPEDVLPSGLEDEIPRDLEAVTLRPDRMNPELRAALEDLEEDEEGLGLAELEEELARADDEQEQEGQDGGLDFDASDEEEDEEEGSGAAAGAGGQPSRGRRGSKDGSASLASEATGLTAAGLRPHKARASYAKAGRGAWEELDDDFVAQAMGKVVIPGVNDGTQEEGQDEAGQVGSGSGRPGLGDAEGFDFDAHVARLMALAEGQMVDVDDLDDQGQDGDEDEDEDEDEDGAGPKDSTLEGARRGGSSSRAADGLLQAMLGAYDDDNLGALDDDPRIRSGQDRGLSKRHSHSTGAGDGAGGQGSSGSAPIRFTLGSGKSSGFTMPDTMPLPADDDEEAEVEYEEYEEEEEGDDDDGHSEGEDGGHGRTRANLDRGEHANGAYVYQEGEDDEDEDDNEDGEDDDDAGAAPGRSGPLDRYLVSKAGAGGAGGASGVYTSRPVKGTAGEHGHGDDDHDEDEGYLGHMDEDERRAAMASAMTDPWGRPVKAVTVDNALAAWEREQETRELESYQMAAKQARTRLRVQEKEEREAARLEALRKDRQRGEGKAGVPHPLAASIAASASASLDEPAVQTASSSSTAPSSFGPAVDKAGNTIPAASGTTGFTVKIGLFAAKASGSGTPAAADAGPTATAASAAAPVQPSTAPASAPAASSSSEPDREVPFGCAEGDLALDALEYFPADWTTARVKPKWDAETILSTHTASEFRPKKLTDNVSLASRYKGGRVPTSLDGRAGKAPVAEGKTAADGAASEAGSTTGSVARSLNPSTGPIRLSKKTGLPVGVKLGPGGALVRVAHAEPVAEPVAEADSDEEEDSSVEDGAGEATLGLARRPDETPEEKKARKAAVKEARRSARESKKALREAFKDEEKRVAGQLRAKDNVALGKGMVIRA